MKDLRENCRVKLVKSLFHRWIQFVILEKKELKFAKYSGISERFLTKLVEGAIEASRPFVRFINDLLLYIFF